MANIIQFKPATAHFSFEKRGGYNLVPAEIIACFFQYMRGIGPDAFILKHYVFTEDATLSNHSEIMRGCIPTEAIDRRTIRQHQQELEVELDTYAVEAKERIKEYASRIYQRQHRGNDIVFVRCQDGIMGCGWYDSAHTTRKGLKLAAFMLYALGSINNDAELLTAVYNYLPYDSELTIAEANQASDIIVKLLADKAKNCRCKN